MEAIMEPTVGIKLRKNASAPQVTAKSTPIISNASHTRTPVVKLIRNCKDR